MGDERKDHWTRGMVVANTWGTIIGGITGSVALIIVLVELLWRGI